MKGKSAFVLFAVINFLGMYNPGVLLCTSHRLIFIQYPLTGEKGGSMGITLCFPIRTISSMQVHRKYKGGNYNALQIVRRDNTGLILLYLDPFPLSDHLLQATFSYVLTLRQTHKYVVIQMSH